MSRGDFVMLRTFLNQPVKRRVCGVDDNSITICTEESWQDQDLRGAVVPRERVFKWDEALFEEMLKFDEHLDNEPPQLSELWNRAIPY